MAGALSQWAGDMREGRPGHLKVQSAAVTASNRPPWTWCGRHPPRRDNPPWCFSPATQRGERLRPGHLRGDGC